jgi:hypothetical protein
MAATPEAFPGFTPEQTPVVGRLASVLALVAPLFLVAGVLRLALGVVEVWRVSWAGLLMLPEGLLLAFCGLALLAGSTDAGFLRDVKGREKEHLTHTYRSLNDATTALVIFGCYFAFLRLIDLLIRLGS